MLSAAYQTDLLVRQINGSVETRQKTNVYFDLRSTYEQVCHKRPNQSPGSVLEILIVVLAALGECSCQPVSIVHSGRLDAAFKTGFLFS